MFFERSTGRRFRLRATLAVMGLVGSSLALSLPARAEFAQPDDDDPTELYVPEGGLLYHGPRTPGRLTPATGALFGTHSDESHEGPSPAPHAEEPGQDQAGAGHRRGPGHLQAGAGARAHARHQQPLHRRRSSTS